MSHDTSPHIPTSPAIVWSDAGRADQFQRWLLDVATQHGLQPDSLRLASADASFRRYFRIEAQDGSRIIMDAPPDKENSAPFVKVAALMHAAGVHGPQVLAWDEPLGFMLLTDLGAQTMMQVINRDEPQANLPLYVQALDALIAWQLSSRPGVLAPYDEAL